MTAEAPGRPAQIGGPRRQPDPKYMTFVEHLQELRQRLGKSLGTIVLGSIVGWFFADRIIDLIDQPLIKYLGPNGGKLVVNTIYGGFTLHLKVAVVMGFMLALPVTVYQMWQFVAPAFGTGANKWAPLWMISALLLFSAGAATGFFVIPLAVSFFVKFQGPHVVVLPFAAEYVSFVTLILLVFGVSFELPLALVSLTATGVTSSAWLASKRVYFFFGVFVFATIATPGADWISPLILGGILYVLYEISIVVSKLLGK